MIDKATRGFSSDYLIGEGGYGSVYRGYLCGSVVAIKKISPVSSHNSVAISVNFYDQVGIQMP